MLKFTVFTVIAAAYTLCEASDAPLQNVDLSSLLQTLQQKIDQSQYKESRQVPVQDENDNVEEDRYGALSELFSADYGKQSKKKENFENSKDLYRNIDQRIIKVQDIQLDDNLHKQFQSSLLNSLSTDKSKKKRKLDNKNDDRRIRDEEATENDRNQQLLVHQILDKEDRNDQKQKNTEERYMVNEQLSRDILNRILNNEKSKLSGQEALENLLNSPKNRAEDEIVAIVEDSSNEDRYDRSDYDDDDDLHDDYSKVYVVLNSEAVKSSKNKNKLNALLSRILSPQPPRAKRHQAKKTYKGFYISPESRILDRRRGGGGNSEDGPDDVPPPPKRSPPRSQPRGSGGGGGGPRRPSARQRNEWAAGGSGGGRGGGYHGGGGGGGSGRSGGHTAIPYMKQHGDIYEREG